MDLDTPVKELGALGKRHASALKEAGIATVRDLLLSFPYRYEDFSASMPLSGVRPDTHVTVTATVAKVASRRSFRRRMTLTEAVLDDGEGTLTALWFNQPYLAKTLETGEHYRFAGKVVKTRFGLRLANPLYERASSAAGYVRPLMPVYSVPAGVSQHVMRKLLLACAPLARRLPEPLPPGLAATYGLTGFAAAVSGAHFPATTKERDAARRRLAFDEMLRLQLSLGRMRRLRSVRRATAVAFDEPATKAFVASLPFALTDDQRRAAWATLKDMAKEVPMHRLLDGDVGSGKTVVAAIAMMNAARDGHQAAIMAPTEILARQHYESLRRFYADQPFAVALWTNAYKRSSAGGNEIVCATKKEASRLREAVADGQVGVVVGTHALIEETVAFRSLALAVIDEQHRFGVRVRQTLATKGADGAQPHLLSMTATPIPRSLALTVFGDLDLSLLKEKPKGRKAVATALVAPADRSRAYAHVRREVAEGRQAFVVCPVIDPSDAYGATSVTEIFDRLKGEELAGVPMGMLHGKMTADQKEEVMTDFLERRTMALVSTSVVEVGVDVPNATVMCIEGAERFGLSQLHQFRGRVGRGEAASRCFLLPSAMSPAIKERLEAMVRIADGFTLAERDLEMRGPGDLLGVAQSGHVRDLLFSSFADLRLIADAREAASAILEDDPDLARSPALRAFLAGAVEKAHLE